MNKRYALIWLVIGIVLAIFFLAEPKLSTLTHTGTPCVEFDQGSELNVSALGLQGEVKAAEADDNRPPGTYAWGVAISMAADIIIAVGLTIEKFAHMKAQAAGRADGVGTFWFYVGILLKNVVGELGNLLAYGLAPASVVAPVGTVSVVANALLAVKFLGEPCRVRDWVALVGVMGGIILIVLAVPEAEEKLTVHHLLSEHFYYSPRSYLYLVSLVPLIGFVTTVVEPRFARRYIVVWLFLCALISSVTVAAARGFASLITQIPEDCSAAHCVHGVLHPPCTQTGLHWLLWGLLGIIALTGAWSEYYRVLATNHFDNTQVLPVYQCFFTICSVLGGMLVYNEFQHITPPKAAMFAGGCSLAIGGTLVLLGGHRRPKIPSEAQEDLGGGEGIARARDGGANGCSSSAHLSEGSAHRRGNRLGRDGLDPEGINGHHSGGSFKGHGAQRLPASSLPRTISDTELSIVVDDAGADFSSPSPNLSRAGTPYVDQCTPLTSPNRPSAAATPDGGAAGEGAGGGGTPYHERMGALLPRPSLLHAEVVGGTSCSRLTTSRLTAAAAGLLPRGCSPGASIPGAGGGSSRQLGSGLTRGSRARTGPVGYGNTPARWQQDWADALRWSLNDEPRGHADRMAEHKAATERRGSGGGRVASTPVGSSISGAIGALSRSASKSSGSPKVAGERGGSSGDRGSSSECECEGGNGSSGGSHKGGRGPRRSRRYRRHSGDEMHEEVGLEQKDAYQNGTTSVAAPPAYTPSKHGVDGADEEGGSTSASPLLESKEMAA